MVHLPTRAVDSTCDSYLDSGGTSILAGITTCQEVAQTPYCWPPNGSRICWSPTTAPAVLFYWPPSYYNSSSSNDTLLVGYNGRSISVLKNLTAGSLGRLLHPDRFLDFSSLGIPDGSNERRLNLTIFLFRNLNDSYTKSSQFQGPIVTLVRGSPTSSATPSASASASSKPPLTTGQIIGTTFGAVVGLIVLLLLIYSYCQQCCLGCCRPGKAETARVKAAERRRIQEERASVQPNVDAIKAAVARGEIWEGPVRRGGMWAVDWPTGPSRVARPSSTGGNDEIRVAGASAGMEELRNELRRIEEQRLELQRIEDQRRELQRIELRRIEEQRLELQRIEEQRREEQRREEQRREEQRLAQRTEDTRIQEEEPPAYEGPPPRYTP